MIEVSFDIRRAEVWRKAEVDFQTMMLLGGASGRFESLEDALTSCPDLFESEWCFRSAEVVTRLPAVKSVDLTSSCLRISMNLPDTVPEGSVNLLRTLAEAYLSRTLLRMWIEVRLPGLSCKCRDNADSFLDGLTETADMIMRERPKGRYVHFFN